MTIKRGELITLTDGKEYVIVDYAQLGSFEYLYLIEQNDFNNKVFCKKIEEDKLTKILDRELIERLTTYFNNR